MPQTTVELNLRAQGVSIICTITTDVLQIKWGGNGGDGKEVGTYRFKWHAITLIVIEAYVKPPGIPFFAQHCFNLAITKCGMGWWY
jgi:hypothetical protein